jgi:RNA polymerase sigma factor (sigma-70 family)
MVMKPASDQLIAWVGRHILPHEPRLRAWLRTAFPACDVDDVVQEAYCRIAAMGDASHVTDSRRYLFHTARNVILQQIRRSRVISIEAASGMAELEDASPLDLLSPERIVGDRQTLARVEKLIDQLPERARRIFRLRKIDGLSQHEIAAQLGIAEVIVENEVSRGLRRILQSMTDEERAEMPRRRPRGNKHDQRSHFRD